MARDARKEAIEINVRVGRVLKARLHEQGLTLSALADRAVVDLSSLSRALNGQEGITLHRLEKIVHVLGLSLSELLASAEELPSDDSL